MDVACARLIDRARGAGWPPAVDHLDVCLNLVQARVLEGPLAPKGRLDVQDGRYLIRVRARGTDPFEPERGKKVSEREITASMATIKQRFTIAHELGHVLMRAAFREQPELLKVLENRSLWEQIEQLCDRA